MAHAIVAATALAVLCLHALCAPADAATMAVLSQGQSLGANDTLVSADGSFELGFFTPRGGDPNRRYLGVMYAHAAEQTIPWVANRDAPVSAAASYSATVRASGELQVLEGDRVVWRTNTSLSSSWPVGNVTLAVTDDGNVVLSTGGGGGSAQPPPLWQSFDHPTDTFLPGMRIKLDRRGGAVKWTLFSSWRSVGDPATGDFTLGLDPLGSAQLYIWRTQENGTNSTHWRSGQWTNANFVGIPWRPLNIYGFHLIDEPLHDFMSLIFTPFNSSLLRFMLDPNGTETCYMLINSTSEWETVGSQPTIPCQRYNLCGANAKCAAGDHGLPVCTCLKGFEPRSPSEYGEGNWTQGCVRSAPLTCQLLNVTGGDDFADLPGVKLPDFATWNSTMGDENACKELCLANCSCVAYSYSSVGPGCLVWGQDLIDISELQDEKGSIYVLHMKVPAAASSLGAEEHHPIWKLVTIVSAVVLFILVYCLLLWWKRGRNIKDVVHKKWRSWYSSSQSQKKSATLDISQSIRFDNELDDGTSHELKVYTLDLIKSATCNFSDSNKLGAGGFGPVFMGKLTGGEEVAVKRLCQNSCQGLEEFKNEVILIAKLQHRNLVRLIGCCIEGEEKILVYEYMPNRSLDAFLFNPELQRFLDWRKRFDIIEGIARGLLYLHRDSRLRVVHRDLKASNILLDASMDPKISDFGTARIFGGDDNQFNTNRVVGTLGYMPPEYAMEGIFSVKSDIYSFGVLIMEIITGKRAVSFLGHQDYQNIAGYAWRQWNEDKGIELIDPSVRESCSLRRVSRCIHIALLCVQDRADDRPDIRSVIRMLSNDNLNLPNPKSLVLRGCDAESGKSCKNEQDHTVGTVSMTQVYGR